MAASAPFIVVTGNIAAGKSTLVDRLATELGLGAYPERVEENPFFGPPSERSLESEAWFLADSVNTHRAIQRGARGGVQERTVREHVAVFAHARARMGWLGEQDLDLLRTLSRLLEEGLRPPDLLIYLQADVAALQQRIAARSRPGEQDLDAGYLALLAELFDELVAGWELSPVFRLDSTGLDVRERHELGIAVEEIQEALA